MVLALRVLLGCLSQGLLPSFGFLRLPQVSDCVTTLWRNHLSAKPYFRLLARLRRFVTFKLAAKVDVPTCLAVVSAGNRIALLALFCF